MNGKITADANVKIKLNMPGINKENTQEGTWRRVKRGQGSDQTTMLV